MSVVLLDTNIVSYILKSDTRAALYAPHLLNQELAIAMMTVAELLQWAAVRKWGATRVRKLEAGDCKIDGVNNAPHYAPRDAVH